LFETISEEEQKLLRFQEEAMLMYSAILGDRIALYANAEIEVEIAIALPEKQV
jgi:hypothetical protein